MTDIPTLVSFDLCPYVQRAAITLLEKGVPFNRVTIDLANKPDWFKAISPLGKVPLLQVGDTVLFESSPIVEYLDEVHAPRLHPADPLVRARHRAMVEMASSMLADVWVIETTADTKAFDDRVAQLRQKAGRIEALLSDGPYFAGAAFSIVDAVFAPLFRYFDTFDRFMDDPVFPDLPRLSAWR
ncbi:MAG: glutathione S-transferase family protein, partial [Pseudomonadota bacterium]